MNEVRPIDANALRERLLILRNMDSWYINGKRDIENARCVQNIFDICLTEVSNAPTVEVETCINYKLCKVRKQCELQKAIEDCED